MKSSLALRISKNTFFSSRRRHTRFDCDWSSDVCSSDLHGQRLSLFWQGLFVLQAFAHEGLALVALERLGFFVGVAGLHLVLLGFWLVAQAGLHESLALVALLVRRFRIAGGHAGLLLGGR